MVLKTDVTGLGAVLDATFVEFDLVDGLGLLCKTFRKNSAPPNVDISAHERHP